MPSGPTGRAFKQEEFYVFHRTLPPPYALVTLGRLSYIRQAYFWQGPFSAIRQP